MKTFLPESALTAPRHSLSAATHTVETASAQVAGWTDLPGKRRKDLLSHLAAVARMAGLPPPSMLLTPDALRRHVLDRPASAYGLSDSRMRNVLSGLRFVLRRLDVIDEAHIPYAPEWQATLDLFADKARLGLTGLARFCSRRGVVPAQVGDVTLRDYEAWLRECTIATDPAKAVSMARQAWNRACTHVEDWPGKPLDRVREASHHVLPLAAFPAAFQADLARFGRHLAGSVLDEEFDPEEGPPLPSRRALRPQTVELRQAHARWAASALAATGVPVEEITSLACLVTPIARVKQVLRFLYDRVDGQASAAGHHVAEVLRIVARHYVKLPEHDIARIRQWSGPVTLTYKGMTEKNERCVNAVMQPDRLQALLHLPETLLDVAERLRAEAPERAASLAMRAVAIEVLTKLPIRLANLIGLRLDRHLQMDDTRAGLFTHLLIPEHETKNRRQIARPISASTASVLRLWVDRFRPHVAPPGCPYLFPGQGRNTGQSITPQAMRDAIKGVLAQHVGVVISPHQFRHLAARLFLDVHGGQHESVRQLLGHASVTTTVRHYAGVGIASIARRFDATLTELKQGTGPARRHSAVPRPSKRERRR